MPERLRTPKRPRDLNQRAADTVARLTGQVPEEPPDAEEVAEPTPEENEARHNAAVALGRLGGKKGGKVRAARMTPEERSESAKKAAKARWNKGTRADG